MALTEPNGMLYDTLLEELRGNLRRNARRALLGLPIES